MMLTFALKEDVQKETKYFKKECISHNLEAILQQNKGTYSALKKCEQGKGVDMSPAVTKQAIILKSELGRLNKWATDSCSEIKHHISQAEKSVLKKEQLLWW